MKPSQIWALGAFVALGLACNARASIIVDLGLFSVSNQNPDTVLAAANADGVDSGVLPDDMDLLNAGRIEDGSGTLTNSFGTFVLTVDTTNNTGTLTFTMNPGFVLAGIGVHAGGGSTDRFFSINDETSGVDEGPFFGSQNKNGMNEAFSNFDIFVEHVPDGGATVMLLGAGLAGIGLVGRRLKR
jgi:hypothetical protein